MVRLRIRTKPHCRIAVFCFVATVMLLATQPPEVLE